MQYLKSAHRLILTGPIFFVAVMAMGALLFMASVASVGAADKIGKCPVDDTCVVIGPVDTIKLATFLDSGTLIGTTANLALSLTFGIDDRRGVEVAYGLRPTAHGHPIEFVGPDTLAGLPNYSENCNNLHRNSDAQPVVCDQNTEYPDPDPLKCNETTANSIVDAGDILAVIGPICTNSAFQTERIFTAGLVTVVSPNNQGSGLTALCPTAGGCRPSDSFYARTASNGLYAGREMAVGADNLGFLTAVTVDDGSAFSNSVANAFKAEFDSLTGGNTVQYSGVTTGPQMDATIKAINIAGAPDFIYFTNTSLGQARLFVTKARDGLDPDAGDGISGDLLSDLAVTNAAGQIKEFWEPGLGGIGNFADGVLVSAIDRTFTTSSEYTNDFLPGYLALSGGVQPINNFHGYSFDAYNIIVDALEAVMIPVNPAKSDAHKKWLIPRNALRAALLATNTTGLTGSLTCDGDGGGVLPPFLVGDCSPGASDFKVSEIACPAPNGTTGTCNFSGVQALP